MITNTWAPDNSEKIAFRLRRDADGYPPADWEHLWAERLPDGLYRLDNTPFFAPGISLGDVVATEEQGDMIVFKKVIDPSRHSTIRVVLFERGAVNELRQSLEQIGCSSELSHLPNLISIDVPPEILLSDVRALLDSGERSGRWEYEEASIRQ